VSLLSGRFSSGGAPSFASVQAASSTLCCRLRPLLLRPCSHRRPSSTSSPPPNRRNTKRRAFPNCTAKPKGERQVYIGDALLDAKDIMSLNMRRPFDRVRGAAGGSYLRGLLVSLLLGSGCWLKALAAVNQQSTSSPPRSSTAENAATSNPTPPSLKPPTAHQGYMVQWDIEKEIWAKAFKSASLSGGGRWDPASTGLLVTEPIFNFPAVQAATEEVRVWGLWTGSGGGFCLLRKEVRWKGAAAVTTATHSARAKSRSGLLNTHILPANPQSTTKTNLTKSKPQPKQMVFEQFGFRSLFAAPAPWFSLNAACSGATAPPNATARSAVAAGCGVVVDAGFSACNVVPFFNGQLLAGAAATRLPSTLPLLLLLLLLGALSLLLPLCLRASRQRTILASSTHQP